MLQTFVRRSTAIVLTFGVVSIATFPSALARTPRAVPSASIVAAAAAIPNDGHVTFIAEGQTIAANRAATVTLHFRVEPGFHINSHTPKSDMLIPTKLVVAMVAGDPEVTAVDFPLGTPFAFAFEPKQKLDVYQGDVVLTTHLKAAPGQHSLKAELRYQACDQAACYPPKKLAVEQPFTAR